MPADTPYARLAAFRATWNDGDCIDEDSKLSAGDLDQILADHKRTLGEDVSDKLGDLA